MIEQLEELLRIAPVMGRFHPLVPLCLSAETEVVDEPATLAREMDNLGISPIRPILITSYDPRFADRFIAMDIVEVPSGERINVQLPYRLTAARRLLTHADVAGRIISDAIQRGYQTVALLLVDGLSYDDVIGWPEQPEPCFVDGVTVTFLRTQNRAIDSGFGFPAIVGRPPIAQRLEAVGIHHARGFSYWDREQNDVSAILFHGMPLERVGGMSQALDRLRSLDLSDLYIQIVREGTDGLAHRRREVTAAEIASTVAAVHRDFRELVDLLAASGSHGAAYLTADHGVLWKHQHLFEPLPFEAVSSARYTRETEISENYAARFGSDQQPAFALHYPYLGTRIRANDSGVHGGLSYWESLVPFVRVEVNS